MSYAIVQFSLGAFVIIIAGIFLVKFADQIAESTKLGKLFVGSLFLAAGTSLPELSIDISAIRNNMPDLAVGNLLGSCLFNLLILGIADLLHKGKRSIFSRASAAHALAACISIGIASVAGISIFLGDLIGHISFLGLGAGTMAIFLSYILGLRLVYRDQNITQKASPVPLEEKGTISLPKAIVGYMAAAMTILFVAPLVASGAGTIAEITGLGTTFVGTTLVSLATTLPELVSTITAIRMGAFDLALGNIFGSNAFNLILLVPLDMLYQGPLLASVSRMHVFTIFSSILVSSVAVMGQLYQVEKRKKFLEPDAFIVIILVLSSLSALYIFRNV